LRSLGDNTSQILLLVLTNAFVGGMVGIERTVLPLVAEADFGIASRAAAVAFIATFGVTKAFVNLYAGRWADRWGRRPLLLGGWVLGLPVPLILMSAPSWNWILFANVLLGANQALTWSMTVVMKVDLASRRTFGLVIGWNEFAGYAGMSIAAALTGFIAATSGLRPDPFYVGLALAVAGLGLSVFAKETRGAAHARDVDEEGTPQRFGLAPPEAGGAATSSRPVLLRAAALGGLATNLKDGALWGLLPILLAARGLSLERIGLVVAVYPAVWAVGQLFFGPLSDRVGRRGLIVGGLALQGVAVLGFAFGASFWMALAAAVVAGFGTAMVYPTLLAFVADVTRPSERASALGTYRFWRDLGYAVGALSAGALVDAAGFSVSLAAVASVLVLGSVVFAAYSTSDGSSPSPNP
jgi:MFS family permease